MLRLSSILSLLSIPTLILLCSLTGLASLPEGYEAPLVVYYSLFLVIVVSSVYFLAVPKSRRNATLFLIVLFSFTGFIALNYKNRGFIRNLEAFPGDPISRFLGTFLGLPAVILHLILETTGIIVPWTSGSIFSIFLVLGFWTVLVRRIRRSLGNRSVDTPPANHLKMNSYFGSHLKFLAVILVFMTVFSIRLLPVLSHWVPAGTDTPLYVAATQGRAPLHQFGGPLRSLLYFMLNTIGVVFGLPYPAPLSQVLLFELIPVIYLSITSLLVLSLVLTCTGDFTSALLAGVFVGLGTGLLRITWDLYKLVLSLPYVLIALQLTVKSLQTSSIKTGILCFLFLVLSVACHLTVGGIAFLTILLYLMTVTVFDDSISRRNRRLLALFLGCGLLIPVLSVPVFDTFAFSSYYHGDLLTPLSHRPEMAITSLSELLKWLGVCFFPLSLIGLLPDWKNAKDSKFLSIWLLAHLFIVWQVLFHTYTYVHQAHRVMLLLSVPTGALAAVGLKKLLGTADPLPHVRLKFTLKFSTVLAVLISGILVANYYGGFLSWSMIHEKGYYTMIWLIDNRDEYNIDVTYAFDSWTGYYGNLQNAQLPTAYYLNEEGSDIASGYNRIFDNGHRVFFRS